MHFLQAREGAFLEDIFDCQLDARRRLASVCLLRRDYAGAKEYCRQVSRPFQELVKMQLCR